MAVKVLSIGLMLLNVLVSLALPAAIMVLVQSLSFRQAINPLMQLATITATFPAMFPSHVRFAGFAITYNVATAIFGGTAAMVNEAAINSTGFLLFPAVYMMASCVIGVIAVKFMPETAGASLRGTEIPDAHDTGILATVPPAARSSRS